MNCPHCSKPLQLMPRAYIHADTYGRHNASTTECCGKIVTVHPIRSYRIEKDTQNRKEDDWGVPVRGK